MMWRFMSPIANAALCLYGVLEGCDVLGFLTGACAVAAIFSLGDAIEKTSE